MSLVMAAKSPSNPYTLVREGKVPGKKKKEKRIKQKCVCLTHLYLIKFPALINLTNPFRI